MAEYSSRCVLSSTESAPSRFPTRYETQPVSATITPATARPITTTCLKPVHMIPTCVSSLTCDVRAAPPGEAYLGHFEVFVGPDTSSLVPCSQPDGVAAVQRGDRLEGYVDGLTPLLVEVV